MSRFSQLVAATFVKCTGFTYSNMARLFIRLFVGVMFMQFGIRHLVSYDSIADSFPTVFNWQSQTCLILMIIIELVCSLFIMVGFLTRLSVIPPIITMIAAEYYIINKLVPQLSVWGLDATDPGYLPIMFIGIYLYILLAGPGKISLDYFISIFLISRDGKDEKEELEEV
ncbi:MAG: DoxX family protein [Paramuribaculum sp.]|nr:DoxX family protein [Paramuribaculum sp.]MDE6461078.1 DoxX family protein [Paramuribaculum sp.]MDE6652370.1 DoxX family protein [Paramuribaculum sp.]